MAGACRAALGEPQHRWLLLPSWQTPRKRREPPAKIRASAPTGGLSPHADRFSRKPEVGIGPSERSTSSFFLFPSYRNSTDTALSRLSFPPFVPSVVPEADAPQPYAVDPPGERSPRDAAALKEKASPGQCGGKRCEAGSGQVPRGSFPARAPLLAGRRLGRLVWPAGSPTKVDGTGGPCWRVPVGINPVEEERRGGLPTSTSTFFATASITGAPAASILWLSWGLYAFSAQRLRGGPINADGTGDEPSYSFRCSAVSHLFHNHTLLCHGSRRERADLEGRTSRCWHLVTRFHLRCRKSAEVPQVGCGVTPHLTPGVGGRSVWLPRFSCRSPTRIFISAG